MRVLHVIRQFYPSIGGMERVTLDLCQRLRTRGIMADVLTLDRDFATGQRLPAWEEVVGVAVRRVPFWGARRYCLPRGVLGHLASYDLLHLHGVDFFLDYLALTQPLHRKPIILSTHGGYFHTAWGAALKRLYFTTVTRWSLQRTHRVICDSDHDLALFRAVAPTKVVRIPNGVDCQVFAQIERNLQPGLLVSVGRLARNKGLSQLLQAFAWAQQQAPELRLLLIGPDWEGLRPSLERIAAQLGIADQATFAGSRPDDEVRQALGRAHLFVSASEYEAFGIAAVEAMSTGVVPLLSRIPAFEELLQGGEYGFLVDFSQPEAAGRELLRAVRMPLPALNLIAQKAKSRASQFDWSRVLDDAVRVYQSAIGEPVTPQIRVEQ